MRAATERALQRLTKWRRVLAAWQCGADTLLVDKENCPARVAAASVSDVLAASVMKSSGLEQTVDARVTDLRENLVGAQL